MSEEIRIRADIWDLCNRKHACEVSSAPDTGVATQIELARLMGEAFRVLSRHLVAPPDDHLILQIFASAAIDSDLVFDEETD
jgi:hypothetical protein